MLWPDQRPPINNGLLLIILLHASYARILQPPLFQIQTVPKFLGCYWVNWVWSEVLCQDFVDWLRIRKKYFCLLLWKVTRIWPVERSRDWMRTEWSLGTSQTASSPVSGIRSCRPHQLTACLISFLTLIRSSKWWGLLTNWCRISWKKSETPMSSNSSKHPNTCPSSFSLVNKVLYHQSSSSLALSSSWNLMYYHILSI